MATIRRRRNGDGSTSYIAQVRRVGYPGTSRSFPNKAAAQVWADSLEKKVDRGAVGAAERMTFNALLQEVEHRLGPSSYAAALEYWREHFGNLKVSKITPQLIDEHRDILFGAPCASNLQKTTRPRSNRTVWAYVQELSHIFGVAIKDLHILTDNPVALVKRPSLPRGRERFLSDDEIGRLLRACKKSDSRSLYAFVLVLLSTGCRRGEALAMEWEHVDVERKWVTLPKTKNGRARGIPLTTSALDALMALERDPSGLVFPSTELAKAFSTALKRAEIEHCRMHDLRHTAASLLARDGHALLDIGKLLGHQDQRMAARYSHIAQGSTAKMVAKTMSKLR